MAKTPTNPKTMNYRPVALAGPTFMDQQSAIRQLNESIRGMIPDQQAAVTSGTDAVNAVAVSGALYTGAVYAAGTYFHWSTVNGQRMYYMNVAGGDMCVYYASVLGKWVIAATTGTSPPTDHWYSGTAGTGGLIATYTASGGTYTGSPVVARALIDVQIAAILANQNTILASMRTLGLIAT